MFDSPPLTNVLFISQMSPRLANIFLLLILIRYNSRETFGMHTFAMAVRNGWPMIIILISFQISTRSSAIKYATLKNCSIYFCVQTILKMEQNNNDEPLMEFSEKSLAWCSSHP